MSGDFASQPLGCFEGVPGSMPDGGLAAAGHAHQRDDHGFESFGWTA
jgi:hypothetical protein